MQTLQSWGVLRPAAKEKIQEPKPPENDEIVIPFSSEISGRRLRHITVFALRSMPTELVEDGYVLQLASGPMLLLESGILHTRNPTWSPPYAPTAGTELQAFELRVAAAEGAREVRWSAQVDLRQTDVVGEDLRHLDLVSEPVVVLRMRNTAALPDVWLTPGLGRWAGERRRLPNRNASNQQIRTSEVCQSGAKVSKLCEELHFWRDQTTELQDQLRGLLAKRREGFARGERHVTLQRRLVELRATVEQRRQGLDLLRAEVAGESGDTDARQRRWRRSAAGVQALSGDGVVASCQPTALLLGRPRLRAAEAQVETSRLGVSGEDGKVGLQHHKLCCQLRCQQIRLLNEVRQVYPLQDCGRYWTIRGLCVASTERLKHQDPQPETERDVNTALGFLSHLLVTLARLLQVPLSVALRRPGSSRSAVVNLNETEALRALSPSRGAFGLGRGGKRPALGEWPLHYSRSGDKAHFETALRLLSDGLNQFLYSRGSSSAERGNLLKCADAILQHEIYGSEETA
ncbi:unnamed protein product [Symbiodinium natans]|uniref:UV radiation resistance-associated gene protein n=1 Tax=Symbiodinium natans TaxID=878477 RepID=A0A812T4U5_9DINO|nr:unnamed protein product [Symbiodinium natans]